MQRVLPDLDDFARTEPGEAQQTESLTPSLGAQPLPPGDGAGIEILAAGPKASALGGRSRGTASAGDPAPISPVSPTPDSSAPPAGGSAFINREESWLAFNRRVLAEAENTDNPLLERVRFLSITASNLDEFFMVRYAALASRVGRGQEMTDPSGLSPRSQLRLITPNAHALMQEQLDILHGQLVPALLCEGIALLTPETMNEVQLAWAEALFRREMLPLLMPHVEQAGTPFPQVAGRVLQLGMLMEARQAKQPLLATMQLPAGIARLIALPPAVGGGFVLAEQIICRFAPRLLTGHRLLGCWAYRVTRDEDFVVTDNPDTSNLIAETEKSLRKRKTGAIVRLEVDAQAPPAFVTRLCEALDIRKYRVIRLSGPLDLTFLAKGLASLPDFDYLRYSKYAGRMPEAFAHAKDLFAVLRGRDAFLHHPYDSFDSVLRFIRDAATDPRVLAISITLYRVSGTSPVIRALCDAAQAGRRVTVLLELKARFDEANNIRWAQVLRRAGCDVIFGMPRLKTHSKIALVVRREGDGLRRYVHLGTGNYNDVTATQYTDMGLITADPALGEDAQSFFNMITGFSREPRMRRLIYAPRMLRQSLTALIQTETANARAGLPSGIFAKMNSLVDPAIIRLLYEAGAAGVPIRLIVRGVCCLRAGVPGLSETIEVRSIVGRFLEHSRVFRFENGGDAKLFLSSADWMPRNLNRRIELMFPVLDAEAIRSIEHVLKMQWRDNQKAWKMQPDGRYARVPVEGEVLNAQEKLMERAGQGNA